MCGIGGVWSAGGIENPGDVARRFAGSLAHRGPDGEGYLAIAAESAARLCASPLEVEAAGRPTGLLIHRRLSILDLVTGDQPMAIEGGRCWIVFNGEIYNYPQLRAEMERESPGSLATRSDTEIILRVYRKWGVEGFRRLNGIFAFALFDADSRHLVLARDPVGVKPLYWCGGPGRVAFASEIRPLLESGYARRELSPDGLAQFLFYRFVPAPATVWADVHKVMPGHALTFDRGGGLVANTDFAAPPPAPDHGGNWGERLAPLFAAAVQRQMLSDVPVGAFLSGGLDSSLVVSCMDRKDGPPKTYAVGFPGEPGCPGELEIAGRAAAVLGTRHQGKQLEQEGYFARLPRAISQAEEPLAHPGMLLQYDLAALAGPEVKVVLTGQGADEPLGGYPRHHAARVLPLLAGPLAGLARSSWVDGLAGRREVVGRVRRVLTATPGLERTAALFSPLTPAQAGMMVKAGGAEQGKAAVLGALAGWWNRSEGMDPVARVLYVDVRTSLAEDLLLVADKMSMAHSLEARVPFLDLDYLAAVESIPGDERVSLWGSRKKIQHEMGRRILPSELSWGLAKSSSPLRKKRGFDVPVTSWFRNVLGDGLQVFLTGPASMLPNWLDAAPVRQIVGEYLRGSGDAYRMVLAFYVLEVWLRNEMSDIA